jgi:ectoine hydroxylase-related dioxygenase (phytanoyl-CoA dioxygenase family)
MTSKEYCTSFTVDQTEEYLSYFNQHGYVIIDNILEQQDIEGSKKEIWDYLVEKSNCLINPNEPETWNNNNWPKDICRNGGFMGRFPYLKKIKLPETLIPKHHCAWKNRENSNVFEVFKQCMGTKRLWMSVDRYGIMRPTRFCLKDVCQEDDIITKDEFKTKENWIHWDLSPFHYGTSAAGFAPNTSVKHESIGTEYGSIRVQGLITLTDCPVEAGGFHCVPGFQGERFFRWREENEAYGNDPSICNRNFVEVPENDAMRPEIVKLPMRAGSLLIWNSQLPHGNYPNTSDSFRMVQYVKMIPVDDPREYLPCFSYSKFTADEWLGGYQPSPLGRKIFGMDEWSDEE